MAQRSSEEGRRDNLPIGKQVAQSSSCLFQNSWERLFTGAVGICNYNALLLAQATLLLIRAEERARELGHRAIGTGDVLWAMFQDEQETSEAVRFLLSGIRRRVVDRQL